CIVGEVKVSDADDRVPDTTRTTIGLDDWQVPLVEVIDLDTIEGVVATHGSVGGDDLLELGAVIVAVLALVVAVGIIVARSSRFRSLRGYASDGNRVVDRAVAVGNGINDVEAI